MSCFSYLVICSLALATLSTATASAAGDASAVSQFLSTHNAARLAVGVPPLSWNATLAADGSRYTRARHASCVSSIRHPPAGSDYGWNVFLASSAGPDRGRRRAAAALRAVVSWDSQKQWYGYGANACAPGHACSSYKQVVWRDTKQLGCAAAACWIPSGDTLAICEYYPPGNYVGERPY